MTTFSRIFPLLALLIGAFPAYPAFAATYFIAATGSDDSTGLTAQAAWRTIAKVNATSIPAGSIVQFRGGDTFIGPLTIPTNGTAIAPIIYTSYGTGRAIITGSLSKGLQSDWTQESANIWYTNTPGITEHGAVWYNTSGTISVSVREQTKGGLNTQGEHYSSADSSRVYVYSAQNPALAYPSGIQVACNYDIINGNGKDYITISNLELAFGGVHGYNSSAIDFVTIQDCKIHHMGGLYAGAPTRLGNGIQFIQSANHCTAQRNLVYECYDAGITWQNPAGTSTANDILIANNFVYNCEYCFEIFNSVAGALMDSIRIVNNTSYNSGGQLMHAQRPVKNNSNHLMMQENAGTVGHLTNFLVQNNIFHTNEASSNLMYVASWNDTSAVYMDHNLWVGTSFCMWLGEYLSTHSAWTASTGKGIGDVLTDPLFTSIGTGDIHTHPLGGGVNKGTDTAIPAGLAGYYGAGADSTRDIGASEYLWTRSTGTGIVLSTELSTSLK